MNAGGSGGPLGLAVYIVESAPANVQSVELSWDGSHVISSPATIQVRPNGSLVWFTQQERQFRIDLCAVGHFHLPVNGGSIVTPAHNVTAIAMDHEGSCAEIAVSVVNT